MHSTIRHIDLPSGGWWELETMPRWKHIRELLSYLPCSDAESRASGRDQDQLVEQALISLTTAWSFREKVSAETLARRDVRDITAAMDLLKREVSSLWDAYSPKELAERLFAGLVTGRIPHEFAEVHIMALTGWSFQSLLETPVDIVERMAIYLAVKQARDLGGDLDLPEEQDEPSTRF